MRKRKSKAKRFDFFFLAFAKRQPSKSSSIESIVLNISHRQNARARIFPHLIEHGRQEHGPEGQEDGKKTFIEHVAIELCK
jgi:arginyl-tRNA synthetase